MFEIGLVSTSLFSFCNENQIWIYSGVFPVVFCALNLGLIPISTLKSCNFSVLACAMNMLCLLSFSNAPSALFDCSLKQSHWINLSFPHAYKYYLVIARIVLAGLNYFHAAVNANTSILVNKLRDT